MLYSIGKFAKEIGVSIQTLRDWNKTHKNNREIFIYSRVSNKGQIKEIKSDKNVKNL